MKNKIAVSSITKEHNFVMFKTSFLIEVSILPKQFVLQNIWF